MLHLGNCKDVLQELLIKGIQVDSIVTDPPYELGFMGKAWDSTGIATDVEMWKLCLQILKPGGHLLSFGGSRTYHRMASAIEDAGFEIRDQVLWLYGSGFPKSLNISKAIDKMAGAKGEVVGTSFRKTDMPTSVFADNQGFNFNGEYELTAPSTDAAKQWDGWGTALKPAHEPIVLARKPLSEKTVASNVLKHGTGGINIDGCRVGSEARVNPAFGVEGWRKLEGRADRFNPTEAIVQGRFPANLIHDGSEEITSLLGSPSRFFYSAKASKSERNKGLEDLESISDKRTMSGGTFVGSSGLDRVVTNKNHHPTVKPLSLMKYLCRLITPPTGIILDPFTGSGTTGIAAKEEGFQFIGIEMNEEYMEIAKARIAYGHQQGR